MNPIIAEMTFTKDTFVAVGIILTALIGLLNFGYAFRHNRRSSYVSSVTSTRLKWIGEVRDQLARFIALIHEAAAFPPSDAAEVQKIHAQIAQHRMLLRLQLAPSAAPLDKRFQNQIESLYRDWQTLGATNIDSRLNDLADCGQEFLWEEWLKVKKEAIYGDPYDTVSRRLRVWWDRLGQ
ncbi:MAG TPA: hypothetical protein VH229_02975 [Candidatus Udaeobacter sp.]|nr:hypothetical protein [Candidatus Udaeobacter sp.]